MFLFKFVVQDTVREIIYIFFKYLIFRLPCVHYLQPKNFHTDVLLNIFFAPNCVGWLVQIFSYDKYRVTVLCVLVTIQNWVSWECEQYHFNTVAYCKIIYNVLQYFKYRSISCMFRQSFVAIVKEHITQRS